MSNEYESIPLMTYAETVQNEQAPVFITSIVLGGVENFIVKRADGSLGRLQQKHSVPGVVEGTPRNTRAYLHKWLDHMEPMERLPDAVLKFKRRLLADSRLSRFWEWFERVEYKGPRFLKDANSITDLFWRATKLPGKPGNMTPKQRAAYFALIKKHTYALAELLQGTIFDGGHEHALTDEELDDSLDKALYQWGDDESEEGHVVAFRVTPDDKYQLSYDYPRCALVETLMELIEWTYWDDQWDGRFFGSSAPIVQSNASTTPVLYFTCTVHDDLESDGIQIPFPILATLANVVLDLPAESIVDEDTVRRQVRRHQARVAERNKANAALRGGGRKSEAFDNSVLFPPF